MNESLMCIVNSGSVVVT